MSSPAHHLHDYLLTLGGLHTAASTFYGGDTPAQPDELTNLRDTPGLVPQEFFGQSQQLETFGVQIVIRAASEAAGETRAWAVHDALKRLGPVTLSGILYTAVWAISGPFSLGADETSITASGSEGRRMWSLNFMGQRART